MKLVFLDNSWERYNESIIQLELFKKYVYEPLTKVKKAAWFNLESFIKN